MIQQLGTLAVLQTTQVPFPAPTSPCGSITPVTLFSPLKAPDIHTLYTHIHTSKTFMHIKLISLKSYTNTTPIKLINYLLKIQNSQVHLIKSYILCLLPLVLLTGPRVLDIPPPSYTPSVE